MPLVNPEDYGEIRAAIDFSLDPVSLEDRIIGMSIYLGSAINDVVLRDPIALTRSDPTEQQHLKNAAILFTAAYLVVAMPRLTKETYGQKYGYERSAVDPSALATSLWARGEAEIDAVLNPGVGDEERPTMFAVGHGRRGRELSRHFPLIDTNAEIVED